jgi:hypothetical protein
MGFDYGALWLPADALSTFGFNDANFFFYYFCSAAV